MNWPPRTSGDWAKYVAAIFIWSFTIALLASLTVGLVMA